MKPIQSFFWLVIVVLVSFAQWPVFGLEAVTTLEANEAVRLVSAREKLSNEPDSVILYAKGLCCPSCAIGIRKHISKLDFVDRKRLNKGVDLDAKTQLVTVAVLEAKKVDYPLLGKAVRRAGYDPVRVYKLENGDLLTEAFPSQGTE